ANARDAEHEHAYAPERVQVVAEPAAEPRSVGRAADGHRDGLSLRVYAALLRIEEPRRAFVEHARAERRDCRTGLLERDAGGAAHEEVSPAVDGARDGQLGGERNLAGGHDQPYRRAGV